MPVVAIGYLDAGRDLVASTAEPWCTGFYSRFEAVPIIQKSSQDDHVTRDFGKSHQSESGHPLKDFMAQQSYASQSQSLRRFGLDTFLDPTVAKTNAFYALHNIFCHVAFSETQVLYKTN